ncbi:MAG: hypothetical protein ACKO9B_16190 [Planctomycetota bacterium]
MLARAVALVATIPMPDADRAALLARVVAECRPAGDGEGVGGKATANVGQ